MNKITLEEFKEKLRSQFDANIEIDDNSFVNMKKPIKAHCKKHDKDVSKNQSYQLLSAKYPCTDCYKESKLKKHIAKFKLAISEYYGDIKYRPKQITNFKQSIEIWCDDHGWQKSDTETVGFKRYGCHRCARITAGKSRIGEQRVPYKSFVAKINRKFNGQLVVITPESEFINQQHDIEVKCADPEHSSYIRTGTQILNSSGCPRCRVSQGERLVNKALDELNIPFEVEKRFATCKDKKELPFDFWLPKQAVLIEFQGRQHYEPWAISGGKKGLPKIQARDKIKKEWAKANNIPILYISDYVDVTQKIAKFIDEVEGNASMRLEALTQRIEKARKAKWNDHKKQLDKKHQGKLSFEQTKWDFGQRKILYECIREGHGEKSSDIYSLLKGHGCPTCAGNEKLDNRIQEAKSFAKSKGGECHSKTYINTDSPLLWSFDRHYYWLASFDSVVKRNSWSPWHAQNHKAFVKQTLEKLVEAGFSEHAQKSLSKYLEKYPDLSEQFKFVR